MKRRLDQYLVEEGLVPTKSQAQALILRGAVLVNGQAATKAGQAVPAEARVELKEGLRYVSRGGLKLEGALHDFGFTVEGLTALDIGASTGGFTDCLLQNGAARVVAIDVGYGQFAWKLRQDPRVRLLERTNIRHLTPQEFGETGDLATIDVSFISLNLVLPAVKALLKEGAPILALVKPQFEAGREKVGSKGVVRDPAVHREVLARVATLAGELGYGVQGITVSPLKGPEGNVEFWLHLAPGGPALDQGELAAVVARGQAMPNKEKSDL